MPATGSGTQAPALVFTDAPGGMFTSIEEMKKLLENATCMSSKRRYDAAAQREHQHTELEEIAGSLRAELNLQAEQHLNHFLLQEQACYNYHLRERGVTFASRGCQY